MKTFQNFISVLLLVLAIAVHGKAQDVTGTWQGMLNFNTGSINPDKIQYNWETDKWTPPYSRYILEIEINALNNNADDGFYNIMSGGSRGKMSIAVTWDANRKLLKYSTKKNLGYGYCMNDATLSYRVEDDYEYLEGIWKGCGMGKIALRRKTIAAGGNHAAAHNPAAELEHSELNGLSFSFPKSWKWDKEDEIITVVSPDDNIFMMMIKTSTADINDAAGLARKSFATVVKDLDLPDAFSETQRNGLTVQTLDGNGILKDNGTSVFVSSQLIQTSDNGNFTVYLAVGEKNAILTNAATMQAVTETFKPVGN